MTNQTVIEVLKQHIEAAKDIRIVTHEKPTADSIGASLALYLGLTALGKKVNIACPDSITVDLSGFVGVQKITQELGKKNFVISLDYQEGSIEKVSYNIEGDKFNLVIEPRDGMEFFSEDKVHFTHAGVKTDLIIAIDTIHLGGLKKLYDDEKDLFASTPIVNIDRHPNNSMFGTVNVVDGHSATTAEMVYEILTVLGLTFTQDIATNILNALYVGTNNFTANNVKARSFEIAAACFNAGGKKFNSAVQDPVEQSENAPKLTDVTPAVKPAQTPSTQKTHTPEDWLKPKIFKSSSVNE